jgi:hypothetical protein
MTEEKTLNSFKSFRKSLANFKKFTSRGSDPEYQENMKSLKKLRLNYESIYKVPELQEAFYDFLIEEFSNHSLEFILEYEKISDDVPDEQLVSIAEYFYETFIKVKAKRELNLSGKRRKALIELFEDSNQLKLKTWFLPKKPKGKQKSMLKKKRTFSWNLRHCQSRTWK